MIILMWSRSENIKYSEISYLILRNERTDIVAPPFIITVTKTTISTAVNIIWRGTDSVFRIAKANATAPRNPKTRV